MPLSVGVSDVKDKNVSRRDFLRDATCIDAEDADMIVVYSQGTRRFELEKSP